MARTPDYTVMVEEVAPRPVSWKTLAIVIGVMAAAVVVIGARKSGESSS